MECHFRVSQITVIDQLLLFVACCCLIIILFITHLFFLFPNLLFTCLLNTCSLFCCWCLVAQIFVFFIIFYNFLCLYPVVYCSLNVPCLYVIYLFSAYLIILWVHLFVPPYSNIILLWFMSKVLIFCSTFVRMLKVITDSLLLFSYNVGLPKPVLSAW